jgi:hypothetical protein
MPLSDEDIGRLIAATPDDYPRGHFHEIAQWRIEARFRSIIQSDLFKDPRSPEVRSYTRNRLHEIYPVLAQRIIEHYCNLPDSPIRHVIIDHPLTSAEEIDAAMRRVIEVTPPGQKSGRPYRCDLRRIDMTGAGYIQTDLRIAATAFLDKNGHDPRLASRLANFLDVKSFRGLALTNEDIDEYCEQAVMNQPPQIPDPALFHLFDDYLVAHEDCLEKSGLPQISRQDRQNLFREHYAARKRLS